MVQHGHIVRICCLSVTYDSHWCGLYEKNKQLGRLFFWGGRGLNAWVAALSAQASDMSGWLLMGLPGAIYSLGTGQIWIAVGLFIGTVLNWVCISHRLRKYTIAANNSLTIPAFFENRFQDKKRILLLLSSIVIVIFFLVLYSFCTGSRR